GWGLLGPSAGEPVTSWATPHLAGIAARILSLKPDLKPFEIKTILYWMFRAGGGGASLKQVKSSYLSQFSRSQLLIPPERRAPGSHFTRGIASGKLQYASLPLI